MGKEKGARNITKDGNSTKKFTTLDESSLKEQTKKLSIEEGISYSVMDGTGLRYITPYALSVGATNTQIGFLTSIPSLMGNFSQLFTSKLIEKHSRKKVILFGVLFQALMWLPLLFVGYLHFYKNLTPMLSAGLIILFYTLLTFFGAFASPAWNSLMRDVVDKNSGKYFGRRNKIVGAVVLVVMLLSGLILNFFKEKNEIFIGFFILIIVAFISRIISVNIFKKHHEPKLKLEKGYYFGFIDFIKQLTKNNFGRFTIFISLIMLTSSIASPFFTVYQLKDLKLSYILWTIISIVSPLSNILFMPLWGNLADRFGNLKILKWTGALIPLVPILWAVTFFLTNIPYNLFIAYMIIIELFSGLVWAGFNLSSITFIYDAVSKQRLALCVAYYNILSGIGVFIGASLGGLLASFNFHLFGMSTIILIFLISGIARFLVYLAMMPKLKEVRQVEKYKKGEFKHEFKSQFKNELKTMLYPLYSKFGIYPLRQV